MENVKEILERLVKHETSLEKSENLFFGGKASNNKIMPDECGYLYFIW